MQVLTIQDLDQEYKEELLDSLREVKSPVIKDQLLSCNPLMP